MHLFASEFYAQTAVAVARELIGAVLVRRLPDGTRLSGRIVETEAYSGTADMASHAYGRVTPRNKIMYGDPGRAYVYFTYGNHFMLNVVTEPDGTPGAVLFRAVEPLDGSETIAQRRSGRPRREWTSGPGRLAAAFDVTKDQNGASLMTSSAGLWIEAGSAVPDSDIETGPRVGLGKRITEPWFSMPWRFWIRDNMYVSKAR